MSLAVQVQPKLHYDSYLYLYLYDDGLVKQCSL